MPDIFDDIHAQAQGFPDAKTFAEASAPTPLMQDAAKLPKPKRTGLANFGNAAVQGAVLPELQTWAVMKHLLQTDRSTLGIGDMPPEAGEDVFDQIHAQAQAGTNTPAWNALSAARMKNEFAENRQMVENRFPVDQEALSGKLGSLVGNVGGILAAGPLAPAHMVARGIGTTEETLANAPQLSAAQKWAYRVGATGLNVAAGTLLPGGGGASLAAKIASPALATAARVGTTAVVGGAENFGINAVQNLLTQQTGVNPNQSLLQGGLEAAATGGLISGVHQGVREFTGGPAAADSNPHGAGNPEVPALTPPGPETPRPGPVEGELMPETAPRPETVEGEVVPPQPQENALARARAKVEAENAKPAPQGGPLARAAEVRPTETPQEEPNFAAAAFENPAGEAQPPVEAKPEVREEPKAAPEVPPEFAGAEFRTPANYGYPPRREGSPAHQQWQGVEDRIAAHEFQPRRVEENPVPPEGVPERRAEMQQATEQQRIQDAILEKNPLAQARENQETKTGEMQHGVPSPEEIALSTPAAKAEPGVPPQEVNAAAEAAKAVGSDYRDFFSKLREETSKFTKGEEGGTNAPAEFVKQSVLPGLTDLGKDVGGMYRGIRRAFGGQTGPEAAGTKSLMRTRNAVLARYTDQIQDRFSAAEKLANKLSPDDQRLITHLAETGQRQKYPELQALVDAGQQEYRDLLDQIQARDPSFKGVSDYMGHAFEDPVKAADFFSAFLNKKPLAGSAEFRRPRRFPTQAEANAAGLKNVTDNAFTMLRLKAYSMKRWITAFDVRQKMEAMGIIKDEPTAPPGRQARIPEGWSKIDDPLFRGKIAPVEAASVLNNALARSPTSHPDFGGALRRMRTFSNTINEFSLAMPTRHAVASTINSALSEVALGFKDLAPFVGFEGKADAWDALKRGVMAATGVGPAIRDYMDATRLHQAWLDPKNSTHEYRMLASLLERAGGRDRPTEEYRTGHTEKMFEAYRKGNPIMALLRIPGAAVEQMAKPVLSRMVPRLKTGAFMQMMRHELAQNPTASWEDLGKISEEVWDNLDDRFGLMVHDNNFWHPVIRFLAHASTRSVGWNIGTARTVIGGGIKDPIHAARAVARGEHPEFTHRMAFTGSLITVTGLAGAMLCYLLTGKPPRDLKDCYHVPTGKKDKDGREIRLDSPDYMNDVTSAHHDPVATLASKLHPAVTAAVELLRNKDFAGTKVYNEDDSVGQRWEDIGLHFLKAAEPLQIKKATESNAGATGIASNLMGFTTSPKHWSMSKAEELAARLARTANEKVEGRTQESAELQKQEADWASQLRGASPQDEDRITKEMVDNPRMSEAKMQSVFRRAAAAQGLPGLVTDPQLGAPELSKIWDVASPDEQEKIRDVVLERIGKAGERASKMAPHDWNEWAKLYKTVTGKEL